MKLFGDCMYNYTLLLKYFVTAARRLEFTFIPKFLAFMLKNALSRTPICCTQTNRHFFDDLYFNTYYLRLHHIKPTNFLVNSYPVRCRPTRVIKYMLLKFTIDDQRLHIFVRLHINSRKMPTKRAENFSIKIEIQLYRRVPTFHFTYNQLQTV